MQFLGFTRVEEGSTITFSNKNALLDIKSIKYYQDNATGNFSKKEFRWSFNGDYWASWEVLNQGNFSGIALGTHKVLFLEIRYLSSGSGKVTSFTLNYDGPAQIAPSGTACPPDSNYIPTSETVQADVYDAQGNCNINNPTLVNAETLCGKSCDYYLWRPNHKGQQAISTITDLQKVLGGLSAAIQDVDVTGADNVTGDGIGVYYNKENKVLYFKTLIEGNKVFISEDVHGHITIDMDDASINELYQLIGNFDGVNVGGGPGEIFKQRAGEDFQFRTLAAGNANVVITTVGDQVRISLDASISGAPTWSDPDPISASVGGWQGGEDVSIGSNSIEILQKMLYEYFPPTVNLYLSPSSGYYEKWDGTVPPATIYGDFNNSNFVKVRVTDISAYVSIDGAAIQPIDTAPTHISYSDVSSGIFSFSDGSFPTWEDVVYHIKTYNNVNGIAMPTLDTSINLTFVEPYIYGLVDDTINIGNITPAIIQNFHSSGQKLIVPKQSNEINYVRDPSMFKIKFVYAYPESYGDLNTIFDVKNDFNVTTSFDVSTLDITIGASSPRPYKVYVKNHWIDVASFKLIFNI